MTEEIKILLGDAAANYTEAQITLAYRMATAEVEAYCNRELDDVLLSVQNEIAKTRLSVLSAPEGSAIASKGEKVLTPNIHVTSEMGWRTHIYNY